MNRERSRSRTVDLHELSTKFRFREIELSFVKLNSILRNPHVTFRLNNTYMEPFPDPMEGSKEVWRIYLKCLPVLFGVFYLL